MNTVIESIRNRIFDSPWERQIDRNLLNQAKNYKEALLMSQAKRNPVLINIKTGFFSY